ncbi:extracellular solute-binding protein [Paenibacillus nasutitermitis]|uniref:Sugar ABC transporter substrate-binding protein n=1 Tax=Paenibacillus nasutitermitis TaxID=1652958 RepID=A0A916ZCY2_9BACL|nr:extracellular solute-binding protein [Paenibacillus nasutitermitis]GGD86944.1 sugar ABC transporter substrate-binding protein [Paenibacillus nasutitermitis]
MKKTKMIALALAAVTFVTTACSAKTQTTDPDTTAVDKDKPYAGTEIRTIFHSNMAASFEKRRKEFEDKTGIIVNGETMGYGDIESKTTNSMLSGGTAYDVVFVDDIYLAKFVEAGWMLPVDEFLEADPALKNDIMPFADKLIKYKDHYYGLPMESSWKSFAYNKEMLSKAGYEKPPVTWDEFIQVSRDLQEKGIVKYGSSWSWMQHEALMVDFYAIVASMGGQIFDDQGNVKLTDEKTVASLQMMVDMLKTHKIVDPSSLQYSEGDVEEAMQTANTAFEFQWGVPLPSLNDKEKSKIIGQSEMSLLPVRSTNEKSATTIGSWVQGISYGSKNKGAAWEFIKFMSGPEGTMNLMVETNYVGTFPGYQSVFDKPELKENMPGYDVVLKQAENAVVRPQVPWYQEWSAMMQVQLQTALTGSKTAEQALKDADAETRKMIEKYKD